MRTIPWHVLGEHTGGRGQGREREREREVCAGGVQDRRHLQGAWCTSAEEALCIFKGPHHNIMTLFFLTHTSRQKPAPIAASSFVSPAKQQTEQEVEEAAASPAPHAEAQTGGKTLAALVRDPKKMSKRGACYYYEH